jgi:hypothetical protein
MTTQGKNRHGSVNQEKEPKNQRKNRNNGVVVPNKTPARDVVKPWRPWRDAVTSAAVDRGRERSSNALACSTLQALFTPYSLSAAQATPQIGGRLSGLTLWTEF